MRAGIVWLIACAWLVAVTQTVAQSEEPPAEPDWSEVGASEAEPAATPDEPTGADESAGAGGEAVGAASEDEGGSDDAPAGRPLPRRSPISDDPEDPQNALRAIRKGREQTERESLFPVSPLKPIHDAADRFEDSLYNAARLRLGLAINHLFQGASESVSGSDKWGTATDLDLTFAWEVLDSGKPTVGEIYMHIEGRWDYGTTGPQELGFVNVAAAGGTANAFDEYQPTFLPFRNLYWQQGSKEAGWAYKIGFITTDATLATSRHLSPVSTFLSNIATGFFANGYPDSGLGAVGVLYPTKDIRLMGLISDANGDRQNWGAVYKGEFYYAFEAGARLFPKTEKAGYSKFTIWRIDEASGAINAATGSEGWGMSVLLEHELTADGNIVAIGRWSRGFNGAAVWKQQAGAHLLVYDPGWIGTIKNDVLGVSFNWVKANDDARDEYNLEVFYRFPFFPGFDTTLTYQSIWDPAGTAQFDHVNVFSVRFRMTF